MYKNKTFSLLSVAALTLIVSLAQAQENSDMGPNSRLQVPGKDLITDKVLNDIHDFINTDIVRLSTTNQNTKLGELSKTEILNLDNQWRAETSSEVQPLITATLSSPLSMYLTRVQAHSKGLYNEMFVMDKNGLNVGQSAISSDYWQGDEDKFQKTYPIGPQAVFIDEPEFDDTLGVWRVQVNMTLANEQSTQSIGAATIEINLSELQRRNNLR